MQKVILVLLLYVCILPTLQAQILPQRSFQAQDYKPKIDSLRSIFGQKVKPVGDQLELAAYLALAYYPSLKHHKIKIRYKKNVKFPITASWSFWNIFKFRKHHTYILLLKTDSFVERLTLNQQVGVIGHEMAHFAYYKRIPSIAMAWWGLKYTLSDRYRYSFEKDADRTAITQGLGWQLLSISFYLNSKEVKDNMEKSGLYGL